MGSVKGVQSKFREKSVNNSLNSLRMAQSPSKISSSSQQGLIDYSKNLKTNQSNSSILNQLLSMNNLQNKMFQNKNTWDLNSTQLSLV